jgi:hypothetical protein
VSEPPIWLWVISGLLLLAAIAGMAWLQVAIYRGRKALIAEIKQYPIDGRIVLDEAGGHIVFDPEQLQRAVDAACRRAARTESAKESD